ncbi:uncharacterized protein LOC134741289 isoform X5 [Cydia strobilella]|uniref:uncharacterized protein LOC134741289 isoform X5 n=1 Tax=Cydia strobilella TaxID=1100964 RepID=UPI00300492B1
MVVWAGVVDPKSKTRTINPNNKLSGPLSVEELKKSDHALIRHAQMESFPHEYKLLQNNKPVLNKSKILSLHPFMKDGLVRVGGRIGLSHYAYEKKHPLILSHEHALTKLLMANAHIRTLHAGPQLLLSTIRERIWPTKGRMLASKIVNKCVPCFRANPKTTNPIMGNLPPSRVNPSPPFAITGIDYGGPYNIRDRTGRGYKVSKCYIAVFICFATKAIHLELITGLESANFLAALRRFIARRGKPKELDFWRRWSRDYIGTLQERTKWRSARGPSLAVDTVVLVRDERLPPCRWRLGKIVATQPGRDGVTRVAVIRTARGDIQRAFNNICPLPTSGEVI